jgi:RNA polymerase subunit RPABC4/transcription elongation factor Spt4
MIAVATQADIVRLKERLEATTDLDALEDLLLECEELLDSICRSIDRTGDDEVKTHLRELKVQVEELRVDAKKKILEAKADRVDPEYARRRAEQWEDESRRFAQQMRELTGAVGEGIGGLVRSIAEVLELPIRPRPAAACPKCGGETVEGAKFCPECGAPLPRELACPACGARLAPRFKFCPECGAKRE